MWKVFLKYASVGVVNTIIHWAVFGVLVLIGCSQAISNLIGFAVAVTFSFFVNAKVTFKSSISGKRYVLFVCFMGLLSYLMGRVSDVCDIHPLITLVAFSATSLVLGFLYSRYIVFPEDK